MSPLDIQEQMIAEQQRLQAVIIFLHLSIFLLLSKIARSSLLLNENEYYFSFFSFKIHGYYGLLKKKDFFGKFTQLEAKLSEFFLRC